MRELYTISVIEYPTRKYPDGKIIAVFSSEDKKEAAKRAVKESKNPDNALVVMTDRKGNRIYNA